MSSTPPLKIDDAKSKALLRTANLLLPHPPGREPLVVLARGSGASVTDVDGNTFLDFDGDAGAALLGHADQRLIVAIDKAVARGFQLPALSEAHVRLAELLVGRFPSVDALSFHADETAALRTILRIARTHTRRARILSLTDRESSYCHDAFFATDSHRVGDVPAALELLRRDPDPFALVLVDPLSRRNGLAYHDESSLRELQECCARHGVLFAVDETVTALRAGVAGVITRMGLRPDMILFGPSLCGGLPLGVVGGKRELLQSTDASLRGDARAPHLLACAAAGVVLQAMAEPDVLPNLSDLAGRYESALHAVIQDSEQRLKLSRLDSLLHLRVNLPGADDARIRVVFQRLRQGLLAHGILWPEDPASPAFLSTAHTAEHIAPLVDAWRASLNEGILES